MSQLSPNNPCERFETESTAHVTSAHISGMISLSTDYRHSPSVTGHENYCDTKMWMTVAEADAIIGVLQDAIACVRQFQGAAKPSPATENAE
jgi:hypothetical protein